MVRHDHIVPVDVLIDDLWGDDPPRTARNSVQRFVSDLRRALGRVGDRLETAADGYRLRAEADDVDSGRFEGLLHAAFTAGNLDDALAFFEQALRG